MNAILNGLKEIHFNIPEEVLQLAFMNNGYMANQILSIDECIMTKLIRPKILIDCDLVGGIDMMIPFDNRHIKQTEATTYILEIPKALTNGKSIMTANNILVNNMLQNDAAYFTAGNAWYTGFNSVSTSPVISAGYKMMNAVSDLNIVQTSRLEVIGENIILISDPTVLISRGILKCSTANSKNLENINPRSYPAFGDLCVIAAKAYIYNFLKVKLDKGFTLGGLEISAIKDTVDEYSDAANMYRDEMKRWRKIAFLNNNLSKAALIRGMIGIQG